jgi:hypothetical protein
MTKYLLITVISFAFLFLSCSKSSTSTSIPAFTEGYDVYLAGTLDSKAVYWKNGVEVDLAAQGVAQSIIVSGSDVYVGGYINNNGSIQATYWKNGQQFVLVNSGISHVFGIGLNGADVYCVGDIVGPSGTVTDSATYWKNGVPFRLSPESNGKALSILFAGPETYISGQVWSASSDSGVVWKNGNKNWYVIGSVNALALSQADTFFVGNVGKAPAYWTQSVLHNLNTIGYATSIAISGTDVYIGGDTIDANNSYQAVYWKNDVVTPLKNSSQYSTVLGIAVAGSDVYAAGAFYENNVYKPSYWKNGSFVKLGDNGEVFSVFAAQH